MSAELAGSFPKEIRRFAWEKFFEDFGAQVELRSVLIVPKS